MKEKTISAFQSMQKKDIKNSFMIKNLGLRSYFLTVTKSDCEKDTVKCTLNNEIFSSFYLRLEQDKDIHPQYFCASGGSHQYGRANKTKDIHFGKEIIQFLIIKYYGCIYKNF